MKQQLFKNFIRLSLFFAVLFMLFLAYKRLSPADRPCQSDKDCVLVDADCCGCRDGGKSIAVHRTFQALYNLNLEKDCSPAKRCLGWYRCDKFKAKCENSQCVVISEGLY